MLGLDDYPSSDEEEAPQQKENGIPTASQDPPLDPATVAPPAQDAPSQGPSLGPALGPSDAGDDAAQPSDAEASAPSSPHTQARQMTHSLTLPPLPNTAIPPSPSGSPAASSSAKVDRFLKLKEQGIHFNSKLASSSQLRNPSLLQNLMDFAGINEGEGAGQYDTTLREEDKPVPSGGFPAWAYVEELNKAQQELQKRREKEKKDAGKMNFVASKDATVSRSGSGTPASVRGSTEQKKGRFDDRSRKRSRSRSPKRKRDR